MDSQVSQIILDSAENKESNANNLKIIFWNIRSIKNIYDLTFADKQLLKKNCAILALSETWQLTAYHPPQLSSMIQICHPAIKIHAVGRASGGLELYYDPNTVQQVETISMSEIWICVKCLLNNINVIVVSVYIRDNYPEERIKMLQDLIQEIVNNDPEVPIIIGGDFNGRIGELNQFSELTLQGSLLSETRYSKDLKINRTGRKLLDAMEPLGLTVLNGRSTSDKCGELTYYGHSGTSTIDYAWVNLEGIQLIKDFKIVNVGHSDHLPIQVTLQVLDEPQDIETQSKRKTYIKWLPDLKEDYQVEVTRALEGQEKDVVEAIKEAALKLKMERKVIAQNTKDKPWYDSMCREHRKKLNKLYRLCCKNNNEQPRRNYIECRKQYMKIIKETKAKYFEQARNLIESAESPQDFWKAIAKHRKKVRKSNPIDAEAWLSYYNSLLPSPDTEELKFRDARHPVLDESFTIQEIKNVIKALKNGKAPGPDGITNEFFKNFPEEELFHITRSINNAFETGKIPENWAVANTMVLHKKGDMLNPENYRPIALLNSITKIFTTALAKRLSNFLEKEEMLPECQAGFAETLGKAKKRLFITFVDFKKAFDSVGHNKLWLKLYQMGVSVQYINVLQDLYAKACTRIVLENNEVTSPINLTRGVFQGDPLSALLFIIMMADMEEFFIQDGQINITKKMALAMYADDVAFITEDIVEMQHFMDTLKKYADTNKLTVNVEKTKLLVVQRKGRTPKIRPLRYDNKIIERVKSFNYLGVTFTSSGSFKMAVEESITKGRMALAAAHNLMVSAKICNWNQHRILLSTTVASTVLYGSAIWGLGNEQRSDIIQRSFIKQVLNLPRNTPDYMLRRETGTTSLAIDIAKRALSLWARICDLNGKRNPKMCLERMKQSPESQSWWHKIKNLLTLTGNENLELAATGTPIREATKDILDKLTSLEYQKDSDKIAQSTFSTIFKQITSTAVGECEDYLIWGLPIEITRTIAQLRLASDARIRIKTKSIDMDIDTAQICLCCKLYENETLRHIIMECAAYETARNKYLGDTEFPEVLYLFNKIHAFNLHNYMLETYKTRAFILSE